jgi:hypothetical protein
VTELNSSQRFCWLYRAACTLTRDALLITLSPACALCPSRQVDKARRSVTWPDRVISTNVTFLGVDERSKVGHGVGMDRGPSFILDKEAVWCQGICCRAQPEAGCTLHFARDHSSLDKFCSLLPLLRVALPTSATTAPRLASPHPTSQPRLPPSRSASAPRPQSRRQCRLIQREVRVRR